jgi:hypothetical protein
MNITSENISETIKKGNPTRKESTIKEYEKKLMTLKKKKNSDNYTFLKDIDDVKELLKSYSPNTQKGYYNAIIVLLLALNHDKVFDELIEKYQKIRDPLNELYMQQQSSGELSEKQKENFASVDELNKMLTMMEKDINRRDIKRKSQLDRSDIELLQVYTMFKFFIRYPTRNNLAGMKLISKSDYNRLKEDEKKNNNYLVREKTDMFISLNNYKTNLKYGEIKFTLDKDIQKVFRLFIKILKKNNNDTLFTIVKKGEEVEINSNLMTQQLTRYSEKYIDKKISTSMIRHIIPSEKFADKNKEQAELAKIMGHSVMTQNQIYVKKKN